MAQVDIKNATIRISDGSLPTVTLDSTNALADVTFTLANHYGTHRNLPRITFTDPSANSAALTVTLSGLDNSDVDVSLATDGAGAITSTAAEVAAAVLAAAGPTNDEPTRLFASVTAEGAGTGVVEAIAQTALASPAINFIELKLGNGTLTYTEKKPREYVLNAKRIDSVRDGADEPIDVSFDAQWEEIRGSSASGAPVGIIEALDQIGNASSWVSSAVDLCEPYAVDISVFLEPNCDTALLGAGEPEQIVIPDFRWESRGANLADGVLNFSGRSNASVVRSVRLPNV